ncbi:MAG: thermonuclease family protein [Alphaproteobacteria bacterium]
MYGALRLAVFLVAAFLAPAAGAPAGEASPLKPSGHGAVRAVVDGDTLVLALDKPVPGAEAAGASGAEVEVRLVGIQAPKLPLGRRGFKAWPLAGEAREALESLTLGRELELSFGGRRMDRHGRLLAHLHDGQGRWIQGEMLSLGLARVYGFADNRRLLPEMLALERDAREAGRGIWGHPYYRVLRPEETAGHIDSFQLVEGRVRAAAVVRRRGYLNFGEDWRSDFTISISPKARRLFEAEGMDIEGLAGRRVRVRGWLKSYNGPMIEATHPEQVEVLDE